MTAWLLTWLWQGVALVVMLGGVLHLLPRVNAATRHLLWWGAFAALIFLGWQSLPARAVTTLPASSASVAAPVATPPMDVATAAPSIAFEVQPLSTPMLSLIMMVWVCVAFFRLLQIFPGLNALYRLKDACRPFPRAVEEHLPLWQERRGRRVQLALCDQVPGAALLGLHDPCIVLPSFLVAELSAADLDQIILHEYGHVQRRDDWMRLLQALLEAALWVHPAAYLIGRQINLEREVACDDWVIARTGSAKSYAGCLSRVADRRRPAAPAFVQALFGQHRDLLRRVDRLLDGRRNAHRNPSFTAASFGMLAIAVCAVHLGAFPLVSERAVDTFTTPVVSEVVSAFPGLSDVEGSRTAIETPFVTEHLVRLTPDTTTVKARLKPAATENAVRLKPDTRTETNPTDTNTTAMSTVEEPPALLPTRVFAGVYHASDEPDGSGSQGKVRLKGDTTGKGQAPFAGVASVGVGIGGAAQKAGVSVASTVTRASLAIARRF